MVAQMVGHLGPHEDYLNLVLFKLGWCLAWLIATLIVLLRPANDEVPFWQNCLPVVALVFAFIASIGIDQLRYEFFLKSYAQQNEYQLRGPGPAAVSYWEGIPDGGTAIVSGPQNPMRLPQSVMVDLMGERFQHCRQFKTERWVCRYD